MHSEIEQLLYQAVCVFGVAENLPCRIYGDPVDSEGNEDTKTSNLAVSVMSTTPSGVSLCGNSSRFIWLLTVIVRVRDFTSAATDYMPRVLAGQIRDQLICTFPKLRKFSGNQSYRIIEEPDPRPPLTGGGWYEIPVEFRVEAIT